MPISETIDERVDELNQYDDERLVEEIELLLIDFKYLIGYLQKKIEYLEDLHKDTKEKFGIP